MTRSDRFARERAGRVWVMNGKIKAFIKKNYVIPSYKYE
jgi:hypothetical protein